MFLNYIINSVISINLSLTCEVSAGTILSQTLGQIKLPCTSNHAKDIRNKKYLWIHKTLTRLEIKHTRKLLIKKKKQQVQACTLAQEQIWSKCSAAEKLFTVLQTTNFDLLNSLHTIFFLFCIDRAWQAFFYQLNKLFRIFNQGSCFYFLLDSLFWVFKLHKEPPAEKPHAHIPYHISGGKCTTMTIPLVPLREMNFCTFRDKHISITSLSSKGEICKKHQARCIGWHAAWQIT